MIFLRSISHIAESLAVIEVNSDIISKGFIIVVWMLSEIRTIRIIPAVTRVEE
jgi:hypothetical protein